MPAAAPIVPPPPGPLPPPPRLLANRDFLLLWQGQLVSQLGNQAFSLAMLYWAMEATGSARLMGLLMMLAMLPGVVLAPLGGALADRHSKLRIIVGSDLLRGASVLGLAWLMLARPGEHGAIVAALMAVVFLNGCVGAAFQPAIAAAIPELVPDERVAAANSLNQLSAQGAVFAGQAAGGLVYAAIGAPLLFLVDGLTYVFSAATESLIRIPQRAAAPAAPGFLSYWRDAAEGFRYLARRRGAGSFLGIAAGVNFFAMPVILLLPFHVADRLGAGPRWYGFVLAGLGAGAMVGYLAAGALRIPARRRSTVFAAAVVATGASFALAGTVRHPAVALGLFFAVGALTGLVNIIVLTLFQVSTPPALRGRVMSFVLAAAGAVAPLGMGLGGILGDLTRHDTPLLYAACGVAIAVLGLLVAGSGAVRGFLGWVATAPAQEGDRL